MISKPNWTVHSKEKERSRIKTRQTTTEKMQKKAQELVDLFARRFPHKFLPHPKRTSPEPDLRNVHVFSTSILALPSINEKTVNQMILMQTSMSFEKFRIGSSVLMPFLVYKSVRNH